MKLRNNRLRQTGILVAELFLGLFLVASLQAGENDAWLAAQISHASGLYQPLMWVGDIPPNEQENQLLLEQMDAIKKSGLALNISGLESFASSYPNSPWLPSLQANLGRYYFEHGRYSEAIQSWKSAWAATKMANDGPARQVADFTFAYWTKLLVGVGQVNVLTPLLEETRNRTFDTQPLRVIVNNTRQEYKQMVAGTDVSFRCGAFALNDMLRALKQPTLDIAKVMKSPAPVTGFSLNRLVELAKQTGVEVVAAKWGPDMTPVIPSVVHWKQDHYASIVAERNGLYQVTDRVFGKAIWLTPVDIQAEASGYFIVPKAKLPNAWTSLTEAEAGQIYGRGYVSSASDPADSCGNGSGGSSGSGGGIAGSGGDGSGGENMKNLAANASRSLSCGTCGGGGSGPGGSGGTGGSGTSCSTCPLGMPVWEVSEPYINTWLYDQPLGYQPGLGDNILFKLAYKQRDVETYNNPRTISANIFSVGDHWNCSWISYVKDDGSGATATMFVAGGGVRIYTLDNTSQEYYSHTTMQRTTDSLGNPNFILSYANGAKDYYQFVPSETLDTHQVAFLTAKVDPFGHSIQFIYQDTGGVATLQKVIDADGRTNTLYYTNVNPSLITGVQDPFGHSVNLQYDSTGGTPMLTNIIDVAGLSSSIQYDTQGWVTNLTTPYGNTSFQHGNSGDDWDSPYFARAVTVVDAMGGTNIYMLRQNSTLDDVGANYLQYYYSTNSVACPVAVPINVPVPFDNNFMYYRNSFHWGPKQAIGVPNDLTTLTVSDFIKARMRHWLHNKTDGGIGQTLSLEQAPSPDGVACGQATWFAYDGQNEYEEGYDSQPAVIARVLPDDMTWYAWYQRDDWGRATNVVTTYSSGYGASPKTRTNVNVYDSNNINLIKNISPLGETTSYAYDANNQLLFVTNAVNEVTAYTYDAQGRRTSVKWPSRLVTTNIYYTSGFAANLLQSSIDLPINRTNSYTYNNNLVYTHTDERGLTTTNTWDALNRLRRVDYPDGTYFTNSYYRLDLVKTVDRMGFPTYYGYDGVRHKIAQTNAIGAVTLYDYCPCGALDSILDAAGNLESFTYNNAGNLLNVTYWEGSISNTVVNYAVNYHSDLLGRITNTVDSAGISTTNWYNNQGLRYAVSNAAGQVSFSQFDLDDRLSNTVDANHVSVNMTYDPLGRVLTRSYPDGGVENYGYAFGVSGPASYTNQISKATFYGYDAAGRKTAETNALNYTTLFNYNPAGDLLTLTDGKNQTTTWRYDAYGRVTNKLDAALNTLFVYQYDPDNRLTNRWSAAKGNTTYSYDGVGNLKHVVYPVSPAITLNYDVMNRLTNMVDAVGNTVYGYDSAGQLLSEDGPWVNDTVRYTYNNRLRTGLSLLQPGATVWTNGYGYDLARRLKNVTSPAGTFGYIYDPVQLQRVDALTLPNGAYIANGYDAVARLTTTWLQNSTNAVLDSYNYGYNQAGQRTNVTRLNNDTVAYTYDNLGELKTAIGREAGGTSRAQEQFGYAYDAAGNLSQRTNNALVQAFNVNTLNELTTATNRGTLTVAGTTTVPATNVTVNGFTANLYADATFALGGFTVTNGINTFMAIGRDALGDLGTNSVTVNLPATNNYTYDLNGNLLSDGTRSFAYDDENQLISVWKTNVWRNDFVYDGKMRRRIARDYTWTNNAWTQTNEIHFVYDGNLVIQERSSNNAVQTTYTRGNDLSGTLQGAGGIGGLLARTDTNSSTFYHANGNGNITCLIDANQNIAAKYLYDPYGNTLAQSGPLAEANTYRFSSKEWNANSGLYYYLYRFYDPNLQRWLNMDPFQEIGWIYRSLRWRIVGVLFGVIRSYDGFNYYKAVNNNSISTIDPWGLACGSGWNEYIIPDSDIFGRYNFTSACQNHDHCYDTCGASKSSCDQRFLNDMLGECKQSKAGVGSWFFSDCERQAYIYYWAVNTFGSGAFSGAQKTACECYMNSLGQYPPSRSDIGVLF